MPGFQEPGSLGTVERVREDTRRYIALTSILGFFLLLVIILLFGRRLLGLTKLDEILQVLTTIASILSGIVGAIIGFYFREQQERTEE